jgi:hypothetical protein
MLLFPSLAFIVVGFCIRAIEGGGFRTPGLNIGFPRWSARHDLEILPTAGQKGTAKGIGPYFLEVREEMHNKWSSDQLLKI